MKEKRNGGFLMDRNRIWKLCIGGAGGRSPKITPHFQ